MGNTVLLSRMLSSLLMLVMNCSASGGAITVSVCSLGSSFVTVIVFEIVIFCCIVVGNCLSISVAQLRYACARFSADFTISLENGGMMLIIWICSVSVVDLFAVSAFLNFVSVSISTS